MWRNFAKQIDTLLWLCTRAFLCHFHNHKLIKSGCNEDSEPKSKTEKFCFNAHKLPLRLSSCLRTFTRSDTWKPETGKGLCVIAVKGTDQISHSTLNCHRSAKIKGEKSPALCYNLLFSHAEVPCLTLYSYVSKQQEQEQQDNKQAVTLKAEDHFRMIFL